jgi:U3 small nucleolar RNA-associated protein 6
VELWCEYAKMELGWCELLKRRWETLGIQLVDGDLEASSSTTQADAEAARKEVLNGAIVKEVLKNALEGLSCHIKK